MIAVVLLGVVPLMAVLLIAIQARTALRRGPRWPAKFFWLPLFSLMALTAGVPRGTAEHLWAGILVAGILGMILVAMVPPPSRATRCLNTPPPRSASYRPSITAAAA